MQQNLWPQRTPSYWRSLSMTLCVLSGIVFLPGCATTTPVAVTKEIPSKLLEPELPGANAWSADWLKLVRDAATDGSAAQSSMTP